MPPGLVKGFRPIDAQQIINHRPKFQQMDMDALQECSHSVLEEAGLPQLLPSHTVLFGEAEANQLEFIIWENLNINIRVHVIEFKCKLSRFQDRAKIKEINDTISHKVDSILSLQQPKKRIWRPRKRIENLMQA